MQRRKADQATTRGTSAANGLVLKDGKKQGRSSPLMMGMTAILLLAASSVLLFPAAGGGTSSYDPSRASSSSDSTMSAQHHGALGEALLRSKTEPLKPKPPPPPPVAPNHNDEGSDNENEEVEYHIVFSTGCSLYQDWQSYVFFYQAMVKKQPGTVTRLVSGCNEEEQAKLQKIFDEQIVPMSPDKFKIHFTPDFSKIKDPNKSYVYFNKPFGMRHWLQNALGFPDAPQNEDAIVILMDPDQLIMRPFTNNNFTNTEWKFIEKGKQPRTKIEHGKPMGQLYGFGLQWKNKINMTAILPNEPSPIDQMDYKEAQAGYIVGPPYVATARDMYAIVCKWCDFAVPVHDQYPFLLAEMFAYCLGAAHLRLAHQTAVSFMVSNVGVGGEGWNYVDRLPDDQVCAPKSDEDLPNVFHFCQRYGLGPYFFGKRKLPKDFLTCGSPLLAEPPITYTSDHVHYPNGATKQFTPKHAKQHRFSLCQMIPAVNAAATYYKQHHCSESEANYDKTLGFHQDMTI